MSYNKLCVKCRFHRAVDNHPGFMSRVGHMCDHPNYLDMVTGEGKYCCASMREKAGFFSRDKLCGPEARLYEERRNEVPIRAEDRL